MAATGGPPADRLGIEVMSASAPIGRSQPILWPAGSAGPAAGLEARRSAIVTRHQTPIASGLLDWTGTTGMLSFTPPDLPQAHMGYVELTAQTGTHRRLSVLHGGGPVVSGYGMNNGLGPIGWGQEIARAAAPPLSLRPNPHTWLAHRDMLIPDPIGTGWSHANGQEAAFAALKAEVVTTAAGIVAHLKLTGRLQEGADLVGGSFGGLRACLVAPLLLQQGIRVERLDLFAPSLDYRFTAGAASNNILPDIANLPTLAATAQYFGRLGPEEQRLAPEALWERVSAFARGDFTRALESARDGGPVDPDVVRTLIRFTGLDPHPGRDVSQYSAQELRDALRIAPKAFCATVAGARDGVPLVSNVTDTRFAYPQATADGPEDPHRRQLKATLGPLYESYLRDQLRFPAPPDQAYRLGVELAQTYDWAPWPPLAEWDAHASYPDAIPALISAFELQPDLEVRVYQGTKDLTVAADRLAHVRDRLPLQYQANFRTFFYDSGHKLHLDPDIQAQILQDSLAP
jgi:carboxypeptidase C (cathepsin A)